MKKVLIYKGLPGSGKTYSAKKLQEDNPGVYKRINKDDLRRMLDNGVWSKSNGKIILDIRDSLIINFLNRGYDVIIDDTNLASKHKARIEQLVSGLASVEIIDFTSVPVDVCIKNDLNRTHSVGERVIRQMHRQFIASKEKIEKPVNNPKLQDVVICDIDGTLALHARRSPYNTAECLTDELNEAVSHTIHALADTGYIKIIVVSGRENIYQDVTERWLNLNKVNYYRIFMRAEGDYREDSIIKQEIYDEHIKNKFNVLLALDDRDRVVDMWRSNGLDCFQVNYGDF